MYLKNEVKFELSFAAQQRYLAFSLFEVCLALREFQKQRLLLLPVERKSLSLGGYHEWFEKPFAVWLDVVSQQVKKFIRRKSRRILHRLLFS